MLHVELTLDCFFSEFRALNHKTPNSEKKQYPTLHILSLISYL